MRGPVASGPTGSPGNSSGEHLLSSAGVPDNITQLCVTPKPMSGPVASGPTGSPGSSSGESSRTVSIDIIGASKYSPDILDGKDTALSHINGRYLIDTSPNVKTSRPSRPSSSWLVSQHFLLRAWLQKGVGYKWMHTKASLQYRRLDDIFTYTIVGVSAFIGTGGFVISTADAPSNARKTHDWMIFVNYVIAFVNFVIATMATIQKIKKFSEKSESHSVAAIQYMKFYRDIALELSLADDPNKDTNEYCRDLKKRFDKLLDISPPIPNNILYKFEKKFARPI